MNVIQLHNLIPESLDKQRLDVALSRLFPDYSRSLIQEWIKNKLKGRYAIARAPSLDNDGNLKTVTFVAFEDQKELTYFMLACPHLRRN